ncbi:MAG: flagellar filament capping protein FliD [Deltaproteobacteria bacterium]|jgi:flagellar hook-associated protein 2|nr:flagellar filament capping protein FliD [Deltaproteobacteria bacterium]
MSSSTGTISGAIKWTGLASGTDFASVVDKLVAIEQRTITRQETWKTEWQNKITAISGLNTRLVSLKLDAQSKDIRSEMLTRKATVTNEAVLSVNNTSTASLGSYEITVGTSIQEKLASRSFLEGDAVGGVDGDLITIQVGSGPVLTLTAREGSGTPPALADNEFYNTGSVEDLATVINNAALANPDLKIKAEVITDKTRTEGLYQRLVLTATEGGSQNKITVTDDGDAGDVTDGTLLQLGKNFIDKPVYGAFLGSDIVASIGTNADYTGPVNKSFTIMALNTGVLGTDDLEFQWADTEGHTGKFSVTASEWNADNDKEFDIFQGLQITFGKDAGSGRVVANEAFSIDCQAPILQKGQDSGMAQTEKLIHTGFSDQISPITSVSAQFVYVYQGVEHSITVPNQASLGILVNTINGDEKNPGVTASVVNDGQGTSTSYHLVLTGYDTGAESTIEISDKTTLTNFNNDNFTVARQASNAMVKVDGFPAGDDNWLQRRNNEVADVIDGAVITLNGVGESTLTITNDSAGMRDKIIQLVESVNFCKTFILENTKWGGSNLVTSMSESGEISTSRETANGLMIGNYGFQIAQSNLDRIMNTNLVPFSQDPSLDLKARQEKRQKYLDDNGLVYSSLSEIGITSDPDNKGLYKVEQSKLLTCINQNPEAVIKLITFTDEYYETGSDGQSKLVEIRGMAQDLSYWMTKMTSDTDVFDEEGNIIQKGKGTMVTLQENYQSIIEGIDAKIAREERRIELVRSRLTDKFNRLEQALQQLQDKQSQLESSLSSLSTGD